VKEGESSREGHRHGPAERKVALSVKAALHEGEDYREYMRNQQGGRASFGDVSARSSDARVGRSQYVPWRYLPYREGAGEPSRQIASPVPPPPPARIPPTRAPRRGCSTAVGSRQSVSCDFGRRGFDARRGRLRPH